MSPLAAYYMMIATETDLRNRQPRYEILPPKKTSFLERVVAGLETLFSLGRPATTQPI